MNLPDHQEESGEKLKKHCARTLSELQCMCLPGIILKQDGGWGYCHIYS